MSTTATTPRRGGRRCVTTCSNKNARAHYCLSVPVIVMIRGNHLDPCFPVSQCGERGGVTHSRGAAGEWGGNLRVFAERVRGFPSPAANARVSRGNVRLGYRIAAGPGTVGGSGPWWMPNVWLCRGPRVSRSRAESPNAARCPLLGSLSLRPTSDPTAHHKPTLTRNTAREHRMASNVAAAKQRPAALKSNRRCPQRVQRNGTAPSFLCLAEAEARAVPAAASSGDDTPGGVTVEYQRKVRQNWISVSSLFWRRSLRHVGRHIFSHVKILTSFVCTIYITHHRWRRS